MVYEQLPPASDFVLAVVHYPKETGDVGLHVRFIAIAVPDEAVVFYLVVVVIEDNTASWQAVPASSPLLLVQSLHRLWDRVVKHEPNIGFVDSHPKGDSGHHHLDLVHHPGALHPVSLPAGNACMVRSCRNAIFDQLFG